MSPATRNIAVFTAGMPAKLNSSQLHRHAGGKTHMASVAGDLCSHIGTVSQVAPVVMSQVARWHMRTRLYDRERS